MKFRNKVYISFLIRLKIIAIALLLFILSSCAVSEPEDVIAPGKLKVELVYSSSFNSQFSNSDFLFAQARDFKIFQDENYADVYQHPNQFLEFADSIVNFNIIRASIRDTAVQVAYGSIPPIEYDSLFFQIAPFEFARLEGQTYPVSTNYFELPIENNFSKVVKIISKIKVEENKTTTLKVHFKLEDNLFRILDDFVFSAKVDTFYIINE